MAISVTNISWAGNIPAATCIITVPAGGVPAGATIIIATTEMSSAPGSVSDTKGNSYSSFGESSGSVPNTWGGQFYSENIAALLSGNSITYTKRRSGVGAAVSAFYATGIKSSGALDTGAAILVSLGSSGHALTSPVPNYVGDLFFGSTHSLASPGTYTQPTGWTNIITAVQNSGSAGVYGGYLIASDGLAKTYTPKFSTTANAYIVLTAWSATGATANPVGTASGIGSASGAGEAAIFSHGTATGAGSASAGGSYTAPTGHATGAGSASGHTGLGIAGTARGSGSALGVLQGALFTVGTAEGAGSASGPGYGFLAGHGYGAAEGAGSASAVGESTAASAGTALGTPIVLGVGAEIAPFVGTAEGAGVAQGVGASLVAILGMADGAGSALGWTAALYVTPPHATWPFDILAPRIAVPDIVAATTGAGRALTGSEQVVATDAGFWQIILDEIPFASNAQKLAWREISATLRGRSGICDVPTFDTPDYGQPAFNFTATLDGDVAPGQTEQFIIVDGPPTLQAGQHFSMLCTSGNFRLFRITKINGYTANYLGSGNTLYDLATWPPAREAITSGAVVEFNQPLCSCRLMTDREMETGYDDYAGRTLAKVTFVEAIN